MSHPPPGFSSALPQTKVSVHCSHQVTPTHFCNWLAPSSSLRWAEDVLILCFPFPFPSTHTLLSHFWMAPLFSMDYT
jgi:hypothetical protein